MEDYIEHVKTIVEALGIEKESVGVKYTDEDPAVEIEGGNYTVCGAILAASEGKIILLSEDRCACSGGKTHLGLTQKLWCDVKSVLGWKNPIYRDERLAMLEHDNLPACVRELQPLGGGHKCKKDGTMGPEYYGCINSVGADKRYCRSS
jgi:uncharacterized protein (DUF169 family)